MPTFLFPSLAAAAAGLIFVPVAIHLINLLRHRRVQWAAMEFLIQAQRKNRTWIMLKQLLLLLLRMLALAAVALMVAQPISQNNWAAILGGGQTHHIVLLDDSYSMSDRWQKTSGFDAGLEVVRRLGKQVAQQNSAQTFTLLRFSRAGSSAAGGGSTGADLAAQTVDSQFLDLLESKCAGLRVSESSAGPADALEAVLKMPAAAADEKRIIHVVSDFRAKDWENPATLRTSLQKLTNAGEKIQLVQCVDRLRPNLAVTSLRALGGTRAVGIAIKMEVAVKNFGADTAVNVPVELKEDGDRPLPGLRIESIKAGETAVLEFEVTYVAAGEHRLEAHIPGDAVAADNARYAVLDIPAALPVLIIDGDTTAATNRRSDANFLMTALAAPGPSPTGIKPQLEAARYLREKPLADFYGIYLANIERLDASEIEALEQYVKDGGGLAFFCGELTSPDFYKRQLYRDGTGLFPAPIIGRTELLVNKLEKTPDLQVSKHPIFKVFQDERNPFINSVNIEKYYAIDRGWKPDGNPAVKVVARLRTGAPLVIERSFGKGRVVAFLTTAATRWNNWGRENPSYVVALQELQSYLAAGRQVELSQLVGQPLEVVFDPTRYGGKVIFAQPGNAVGATTVDASPVPTGLKAISTDANASGFYEAQLTTADGRNELRRFARNVDPDEGNLQLLDGPQLATRLKGVDYQFAKADDFTVGSQDQAGRKLSSAILYTLVALLLGEQVLAYSASYHPAKRGLARGANR